jgi:hypothetical protein
MAIEINKAYEPFNDQMDTTRGNPDRKPFGKTPNADQFNLGSEYDVTNPPVTPEPVVTTTPAVPEKKFTHKLANGTVLEAPTVEALAEAIEKSITQAPAAPVEFEDKPLYAPMEFKRKDLTLAEQAEILNLWKENPQAALRKLEEAEYGAPMDSILQNLSRAETRELHRRQEEAAAEFLGECDTYKATRANGKKLTDHLEKLGKPITKQNLVLSFHQLVAAGDKSLLQTPGEQAPPEPGTQTEEVLTEAPAPPVHVPSNQGIPEAPAKGQVDVAKFASLSLAEQKKFFADLRRGT